MDIPDFNFTEKDLDTTFIGQWDLHHIDNFGSIKAGTESIKTVVRSYIDFDTKNINLISIIPERNGVTNVYMDGSTGFYGTISERTTNYKEAELIRMNVLYIKLLKAKNVLKDFIIKDNKKIWKTSAEMDDIIFNYDNKYTYPFYYFGTNEYNPKLIGMFIKIPIQNFNHYIRMRDLWIKDYKGVERIPCRET